MMPRAVAYYLPDHGDNPVLLRTVRDIDVLIAELLDQSFDYSVAAIYSTGRPSNPEGLPDHELLLAVDRFDRVGALRHSQADTATAMGVPSTHDEVVYYYMGNLLEFPAGSDLPLETIREAVVEFLRTGSRPTMVDWVTTS
jgi:hypothetical protein